MPPLPGWNRALFLQVRENRIHNPWPVADTVRAKNVYLIEEFSPRWSALPDRYVFGATITGNVADTEYWAIDIDWFGPFTFSGASGFNQNARQWQFIINYQVNPPWAPGRAGLTYTFSYRRAGFADPYEEYWLWPLWNEEGNWTGITWEWDHLSAQPVQWLRFDNLGDNPDTDWPDDNPLISSGFWYPVSRNQPLPGLGPVVVDPDSEAIAPGKTRGHRGEDLALDRRVG